MAERGNSSMWGLLQTLLTSETAPMVAPSPSMGNLTAPPDPRARAMQPPGQPGLPPEPNALVNEMAASAARPPRLLSPDFFGDPNVISPATSRINGELLNKGDQVAPPREREVAPPPRPQWTNPRPPPAPTDRSAMLEGSSGTPRLLGMAADDMLPTGNFDPMGQARPEAPQSQTSPFVTRPPEDQIAAARAYLKETATPGGTMSRQGTDLAIDRLHPSFAVNMAAAVRQARAEGIPVSVFSAYRPPGMGVSGYEGNKVEAAFKSLHGYGIGVDVDGIGSAGSSTAKRFQQIAEAAGAFNPYGYRNGDEFNHYQHVPVKGGKAFEAAYPGAYAAMRASITKNGPEDLEAMWSAVDNSTFDSEEAIAKLGYTGEDAVKDFQRDYGLEDIDGIAGPLTREAVVAAYGGVPARSPGVDPETDLMARVMLAEARGEGDDGMAGVGAVILNRTQAGVDRWGNTIESVVTAEDQFADPIARSSVSPEEYDRAVQIAQGLRDGTIQPPAEARAATHFANVDASDPKKLAQITNVADVTGTLGRHTYYVEPTPASAGQDAINTMIASGDEVPTPRLRQDALMGGPLGDVIEQGSQTGDRTMSQTQGVSNQGTQTGDRSMAQPPPAPPRLNPAEMAMDRQLMEQVTGGARPQASPPSAPASDVFSEADRAARDLEDKMVTAVLDKVERGETLNEVDNRIIDRWREHGGEPNDPIVQRMYQLLGPHPNEVAAQPPPGEPPALTPDQIDEATRVDENGNYLNPPTGEPPLPPPTRSIQPPPQPVPTLQPEPAGVVPREIGPELVGGLPTAPGFGDRRPQPPTPQARPEYDFKPTIGRGSRGTEVRELQQKIASAMPGVLPDNFVDGKFGPYTEGVVRSIQKRAGIDVDGVVGPQTWPVVDSLVKGIPTPPARPSTAVDIFAGTDRTGGVPRLAPPPVPAVTPAVIGPQFNESSFPPPSTASARTGPPKIISDAAFPTRTFDDIHGTFIKGPSLLTDVGQAVGLSNPVVQGKSPPRLSLDSMQGSSEYAFDPVKPASLSPGDSGAGITPVSLTEPSTPTVAPTTTPVPGQPGYTGGGPTGGGTNPATYTTSTGTSGAGMAGTGGSSGTSTGTAGTGGSGGSTPPSYYDSSRGGWQTWNSSTNSYQSAA